MQVRIDDYPPIRISILGAEQAIAPMRSTDNAGVPSVAFLRKLTDWLQRQGLKDAGTAVAWQFWIWLGYYRRACAAATKSHAQIAYWYKINPFAITEEQQIGLLANLHAMQCQERIYRQDYDPSDYEGVYQLFKRAYDDEDLAQRQKSAAFAMFVDKRMQADRR